jgi:Trypsin-co-occurring domain 1
MAGYLRFASGEGESADVLVEVDGAGDLPVAGEEDAGLGRRVRDQAGAVVAVAQSGFEEAVRRVVGGNARAFLAAAGALDEPPAELEVTFGLKVTGEAGNLAVGKVAGESNYQVRMLWQHQGGGQPASGSDEAV